MFEEAARKHIHWYCSVGGGSPSVKGKLHSMGCVLDKNHVLTAYHCWSAISSQYGYDWPVILGLNGLFRCKVIFKAIDADIAVLRTVELLEKRDLFTHKEYPNLSKTPLWLGASVGFLSRLELTTESAHTHFAMGVVSMLFPSENSQWINFTLSTTVIQMGFSGSAVFRPNGDIVGVLIRRFSFLADKADPNAIRYVLPVVTPIQSLIDDINAAISMEG